MNLWNPMVREMIGMMPKHITPVSVGEMTHRIIIVLMMKSTARTNMEKLVPSAS